MRGAAVLATLLLGACAMQDGLHEALYRVGNPDEGRMGLGALALLPPWKVHSPRSCAWLSVPGAAPRARDNYAALADLCRKDERGVLVASR
ncbi:hypothetical protein [Azospirillum sp.]|uniref:hypothetical protein n=1 Tax=Azospirillum sp. TaxID=34012 RepID=UPI003D727FD9